MIPPEFELQKEIEAQDAILTELEGVRGRVRRIIHQCYRKDLYMILASSLVTSILWWAHGWQVGLIIALLYLLMIARGIRNTMLVRQSLLKPLRQLDELLS